MSTSIRIKDDVYSRLEINVKGYESVSDTIARATFHLEVCESLEMISRLIESSIQYLSDGDIAPEKAMLVHYKEEALEKAMSLAMRLYPDHQITYKIKVNSLSLLVVEKQPT